MSEVKLVKPSLTDDLQEQINRILPVITHIQYAGEKMYLASLSQSRQRLRNGLRFQNDDCSIRPIKLYFDKPAGENQYVQPFVYNRLGENIKESSMGYNQGLFRGGNPKRTHRKEKGWGQVNITQNIQQAWRKNPGKQHGL